MLCRIAFRRLQLGRNVFHCGVRHGIALVRVACAFVAGFGTLILPGPTRAQSELSADQILLHVKSELRQTAVPPYVVYTLDRTDTHDGQFDMLNSYRLRIWCRTKDRVAMARRVFGTHDMGPLQFVNVVFDQPSDPGPPTDLLFSAAHWQQPAQVAESTLRVLASVRVDTNADYRSSLVDAGGSTYHLRLRPLRDAVHERVRDVWVDKSDFSLTRAIVYDHLYLGFDALPELFDLRYTVADGVRVISVIHAVSDDLTGSSGAPDYQSEFRFSDFAFPDSLPDWYFEPQSYRQHIAEAPSF